MCTLVLFFFMKVHVTKDRERKRTSAGGKCATENYTKLWKTIKITRRAGQTVVRGSFVVARNVSVDLRLLMNV